MNSINILQSEIPKTHGIVVTGVGHDLATKPPPMVSELRVGHICHAAVWTAQPGQSPASLSMLKLTLYQPFKVSTFMK